LKFIDEFRQGPVAKKLADQIRDKAKDHPMMFMEVCGTHTMAIARYGIRDLLPESVSLISGPGCPVCVTPNQTIDRAIALSRESNVIVTTFGDMMKVPGSSSSLDLEHARGRDIRVVTSTLESLTLAKQNPDKKVVFLGVGFETTAPTIAVSLQEAKKTNIPNFFVLCAHKTMPYAMRTLSTGDLKINGYICPGHVSAIIGSRPYDFLADEFGISCVITGFEPLDVLQGILLLVSQIQDEKARVEIQYTRVVKPEGNLTAQQVIDTVFEPYDSEWRGIGVIPKSGLKIRAAYQNWDAELQIPVKVEPTKEPKGCLCGMVLQGLVKPPECSHFGKTCTPDNPVGPCMVSSEGTCAAYFKYHL